MLSFDNSTAMHIKPYKPYIHPGGIRTRILGFICCCQTFPNQSSHEKWWWDVANVFFYEMMLVALAPLVEITIFESLPQVKVDRLKFICFYKHQNYIFTEVSLLPTKFSHKCYTHTYICGVIPSSYVHKYNQKGILPWNKISYPVTKVHTQVQISDSGTKVHTRVSKWETDLSCRIQNRNTPRQPEDTLRIRINFFLVLLRDKFRVDACMYVISSGESLLMNVSVPFT
jgi:hypothetical protein